MDFGLNTATIAARQLDNLQCKRNVAVTNRGTMVPTSANRSLPDVIRKVGWSFANEVCRAASIALVVILLARHLGPTEFGAFVFGLSIVKIGWVVARVGLDRIVGRELVLLPRGSRPASKEKWMGLLHDPAFLLFQHDDHPFGPWITLLPN